MPPKNIKIDFPYSLYALLITLGINERAINIPKPKGINISKFRLAILPMIIGYMPMANRKALPDIPGKSKKEQAKNPDKIKLMKLGL